MNPLKECPNKPNCVSTTSTSRAHSLLPLHYKGSREATMQKIKSIVTSLPRTHIEKEEPNYLHVTFKSAIFGFVDDVEFYLDDNSHLVHFRSASRVGYSDLGVNRSRMENIIKLYGKK
ncbi:MAG: DUF1499 domain-containing protein [Bdellovibrionaceae bacterium]|nr:DUF1499 domain-containing protein [Pseudobdellovibrionaceae bacterium]